MHFYSRILALGAQILCILQPYPSHGSSDPMQFYSRILAPGGIPAMGAQHLGIFTAVY